MKINFLDLTVNAYNWQSRRKLEKIAELDIRHKRIKENLYEINPLIQIKTAKELFPWIDLDDNEFRQQWEFKGLDLKGYFDYTNRILISVTRYNEPGFNVIFPFYCYKEDGKGPFPVLVDRGWFPDYWNDKFDKAAKANSHIEENIIGVLYKGDKKNQFSQENDLKNNKFFTQRPEEIAKILNLDNYEICSKFIVKERKTEDYKKIYPQKVNINELMFTQISPQKHQEYAYFWFFVSSLNLATNVYVWLI